MKKEGMTGQNQSADMSPDHLLMKKSGATTGNSHSGSGSQNRQVMNSYGGYTKIDGHQQLPTSIMA